MINGFPKIFAIGSKQTERLFLDEVEITEKIDGSQIGSVNTMKKMKNMNIVNGNKE